MKKILLFLLFTLAASIQAQASLFDNIGVAAKNEMPPAMDDAFSFSAEVADAHTIQALFTIAEGNYIYRNKIKFELINAEQAELLPYSLPAGEIKDDEIFGPTEVYHHNTSFPLSIKRGASPQEVTLVVHYQGCSETFNICYPPTKRQFDLSLPATEINTSNTTETTNTADSATATQQPSLLEHDRIAQSLAQDGLIEILIGFFGLGVLLAFTPCVFPMIPILSSIIVGEGERITTHRAFILSLTYVLSMSVTYTAAGVLTGLLGENLQSALQNPWIIGSFSALFVILSLSMFGLYELQLPQALQNRLHQLSHRQQGGHLWGVALMGLLSGLIVGPCLAPPLAGALIFIGQQGDPVLGGAALFSLSMGMGAPLLVIGTSAGSLLPKAGGWMNSIKAVFGVLMLALAIWLLERIIPTWVSLLLWGSLLIVVAVYLGALSTLSIESSGWQKLSKGVGVIILLYGSLLVIGASSGSGHSVWQPLQGLTQQSTGMATASHGIKFTRINSLADLEQQLQKDQPALLDLYADWCVDCKTMELTTFQDPAVMAALSDTNVLQLDLTKNTEEHQALLKEFGLFGPPTILFFDAQGREYRQHRLVGAADAEAFLQHLQRIPEIAN